MKWYKQDCKSHTDEKIRDLCFRFGFEGYGIYITLLELIGEKIDGRKIPKITISDPVLRGILRVSHKKLTAILSFLNQNSLVFSNFNGEYWTLDCPNMLKRLDNWTRDFRATSEQASAQQEGEVKNKKETEKETILQALSHELFSSVTEAQKTALLDQYPEPFLLEAFSRYTASAAKNNIFRMKSSTIFEWLQKDFARSANPPIKKRDTRLRGFD